MTGTRHEQSAAALVQEAFNPDASNFIRFTDWKKDGNKNVISVGAPPLFDDYLHHVVAASRGGPGAIGVSPLSESARPDEAEPTATFAALDLDHSEPRALAPLTEQLANHGVSSYLSTGTTGRGTHVFFLFDEPLDGAVAYEFAAAVGRLAGQMGHAFEPFPSSARQVGNRLLLPYRASGEDGYGANPLLIPGDLRAIPVAALPYIQRSSAADVKRLLNEMRRDREPQRRGSWARPAALGSFDLAVEEARAASHWHVRRRQHLALGLAAAAAMTGVPESLVIDAVLRLEQGGPRNREPERRVEAVRRTYTRYHNHEPISVRIHYERAGVPAPEIRLGDATVIARLGSIDRSRLVALGRASGTATLVLDALVALAERHGRAVADGVHVSVSWRALAEEAGVADSTLGLTLNRLANIAVLRQEPRVGRHPAHSGAFTLLAPGAGDEEGPADLPDEGQYECTDFDTNHVFTPSALGTSAGRVFRALASRGAQKPSEIRRATGLSAAAVRRAVSRLVEHEIAVRDAETCRLSSDADERMARAADHFGVTGRREHRIKKHQQQRLGYRTKVVPGIIVKQARSN